MMVERDLSAPVTRSTKPPRPVLTVEGLSHRDVAVPRGSMASASPFEPARFSRLRGSTGNGQARPARYAGWHPARSWRAHRARRARHHPHERAAASGCGTCLHSGRSRQHRPGARHEHHRQSGNARFRTARRCRVGPCCGSRPCAPPRANGSGPSTSAPPMSMCRPARYPRNQQKVVLAREIGRRPRMLMAFQPTWGSIPAATRFVIDRCWHCAMPAAPCCTSRPSLRKC